MMLLPFILEESGHDIQVSFPVLTWTGIYFVPCRASDRQMLLLLHGDRAVLEENDAPQNNPKFTADF
jgi:hypothetical protein